MALDISIGLKRPKLEELRDELTKALAEPDDGSRKTVGIEMHLNDDGASEGISTLRIDNDDMERDEVPPDASYCYVTEA